MTRSSRLLPLLAGLLLTVPAHAPAQAKGKGFNKRISTFKKAIRSKDPKTKQRAFDLLREVHDPAGLHAVVWGVKRVVDSGDDIRKRQAEQEGIFEDQVNKLHDVTQTFETSAKSSRDMQTYNKKERKISKAREAAVKALKNLENEHTLNRSLMQQAVLVAEEIVSKLEGEALTDGLTCLTTAWLHSKALADKLRWVAVLESIRMPEVVASLHAVVDSNAIDVPVRVAAINALAGQDDAVMMGKAFEMLTLPIEQVVLHRAAIRALRQIHDRRCVLPLIRYLERTDLKGSREVAFNALASLTGQDHGPYATQWLKWWEDNRDSFEMPKDPKPTGVIKKVDGGKSFYGIQTFSDRVLFIVDISGSMDRTGKKKDGKAAATGPTKWEVCRQELTGFVFSLNTGDGFNVIFFNHQVIPWQNRKVTATEKTKKMLKKWVEAQEPVGGTNIYDALERGFTVASFGVTGTARPPIDTIFFLTDGKPTAGKLLDSQLILEVMREWNKTAQLTIHCVGIGDDHDEAFMHELAKIGDGRYVKR